MPTYRSIADLKRVDFSPSQPDKESTPNSLVDNADDIWIIKPAFANLRRFDLQRASLMRADLESTDLTIVRLNHANLSNARLDNARLYQASLQNAQLKGARLVGAKLGGASLAGAKLKSVLFDGTAFDDDTVFEGAVFDGAAFRNVKIPAEILRQTPTDRIFADYSVELPDGTRPDDPNWPAHWPKVDQELNEKELSELFVSKWRAWQATLPPGWDK